MVVARGQRQLRVVRLVVNIEMKLLGSVEIKEMICDRKLNMERVEKKYIVKARTEST